MGRQRPPVIIILDTHAALRCNVAIATARAAAGSSFTGCHRGAAAQA